MYGKVLSIGNVFPWLGVTVTQVTMRTRPLHLGEIVLEFSRRTTYNLCERQGKNRVISARESDPSPWAVLTSAPGRGASPWDDWHSVQENAASRWDVSPSAPENAPRPSLLIIRITVGFKITVKLRNFPEMWWHAPSPKSLNTVIIHNSWNKMLFLLAKEVWISKKWRISVYLCYGEGDL